MKALIIRSTLAVWAGVVTWIIPVRPMLAQAPSVQLLLPGSEYAASDIPSNATGRWWVLHLPGGISELGSFEIEIALVPGCHDEGADRTGRAVRVPEARDPILLLRGYPNLAGGQVPTSFVDRGDGEAKRVEAIWNGMPLAVQHLADLPPGDQPGEYRIELAVGPQRYVLHRDQWHGDGHWRVRWIGDLNRDGWPDLLLDASYKYSAYTTRLFVSRQTNGQFDLPEVAVLHHTAC